MITGFNTDIDCNGQVFHIQTEDKGLANPVIETLVYTGGQIVCARKSSYSELVAAGDCEEQAVLQRMEVQHRELIREIREGHLKKEDLQPFGWNVVSNRSFDQVVKSFLDENVPLERIKLAVAGSESLRAGARATLRLVVTEESTERPIGGAHVVVRLRTGESTDELFSASTDETGCVAAPFEIPARSGASATLVCEVEAAGKTAEVEYRVKRRERPSAPRS